MEEQAMTRTDTFGQLVDRFIIARLKAHHHRLAGHESLAIVVQDEAKMLARAANELLAAAKAGDSAPQAKPNTRFHDHAQIEGKELQKPYTIWDAVDALVGFHATYWTHQGWVNQAKLSLRQSEHMGEHGIDLANSCRLVIVDSQRQCDLMNQHRSQMIQWLDELFMEHLRRLDSE